MTATAERPGDAVDVVIVGGGIAGLTLALQLHAQRPGTTITVVERQPHPVPETIHKVGESTVEIAGYYLREVLGLGEHLAAEQLNKFGLRLFFTRDGNHDIARRVEFGHSVRPPGAVGTYQIDRGRLENALGRMLPARGIGFLTAKVDRIQLMPEDPYHRIVIRTADGSTRTVAARWIVDATGRSALLKRQLGLAEKVGHHANAAWFRVGHPIDIDDWSSDPQWHHRIREGRRELSTNHLMGPGYWVWLIRLASGATSIGIVAAADAHPFAEFNTFERAMQWLREHEPQCAKVVAQHRDKVLDFRVMKDYAYSSKQVFSQDRWCLAGEAGVFLDPLYSPGLDLIAIGNGLITDLIGHALDGEDAEQAADRAAIHDQVFRLIAEGWLRIYQDQYPLMGNARVMLAKTIWDTAAYWAVPGLLYFHDRIRRLAEHPGIVADLARFSAIGARVQRFLREWAVLDDGPDPDPFVRFYDFEFMRSLHIGMTADLGDDGFATRFAANVRLIERLSGQLVDEVTAEFVNSGAVDKQHRAHRWRADPELAALVQAYEQDRGTDPVDARWIGARPVGIGEGA